MAETIFTCNCGMILKVYGENLIGHQIVCPSCGSTVVVPTVSMPVPEPTPVVSDGSAALPASSSFVKRFGLLYLGGSTILTLGLAKFVLMPILARPVAIAHNDPDTKVPPRSTERDAKEDEAPRRLKLPPRATPSRSHDPATVPRDEEHPRPKAFTFHPPPTAKRPGPRVPSTTPFPPPTAPDMGGEPEKSDEPEPSAPRGRMGGPLGGMPPAPRGRMGGPLGGMPSTPRGGMGGPFGGMGGPFRGMGGPFGGMGGPFGGLPSAPRGGRARPKARGPVTDRPLSTTPNPKEKVDEKSEYEHIENQEARRSLEFAKKNTRVLDDTWTAEKLLNQAEKAGKDDPKVQEEVKKLRQKIKLMRDQAP